MNSWVVVAQHIIPALGRPRQADLCEFEASLVYGVVPGLLGYTEKPCLKKTKTGLGSARFDPQKKTKIAKEKSRTKQETRLYKKTNKRPKENQQLSS